MAEATARQTASQLPRMAPVDAATPVPRAWRGVHARSCLPTRKVAPHTRKAEPGAHDAALGEKLPIPGSPAGAGHRASSAPEAVETRKVGPNAQSTDFAFLSHSLELWCCKIRRRGSQTLGHTGFFPRKLFWSLVGVSSNQYG